MPINKRKKLRTEDAKRRRKLYWDKNDGRCFYCETKTILPEDLPEGSRINPPLNMATIDHIISRNHPQYMEQHQNDFLVLCCYDCNKLKSEVENKGTKKAILKWRRKITTTALNTLRFLEKLYCKQIAK